MKNSKTSGSKTAFIRARIKPELKAEVESMFEDWGITPTQAINLYYKQIKRIKGLPFEFAKPNQETERAIKEAKQEKGIVKCKDEKDLFERLGL